MKITISTLALLSTLSFSSQLEAQKQTPKKAKNAKESLGKIDPIRDETIKNEGLTILYGNAMIQKLQEEGSFESYLQLADAGKKTQFRSCAYPGDTVDFRIRSSRFGLHLKYLLQNWESDRVIMAFGTNESYEGASGITKFESDLESYLELIKARHNGSKLILASPIATEKDSSIQGSDLAMRNADIKLYAEAIKKVAKKHSIKFVDLYTPTTELFKSSDGIYTVNGQNLSDKGSAAVGRLLASSLNDKVDAVNADSTAFKSVQKMVQRKALEVSQAYHPSNGISYYGLRARPYEYNYEIPHHLKLANILDQAIWKQSSDVSVSISIPQLPVYQISKLPNSKPKRGLGIIKSSKEDLKDFTLAPGFEVNCFASSEDHPELINPLQIQFDGRGRLWVTCFSSYPHPLPGNVSNDTILIFEDTDNDGKADTKTIFAEGLDLPDGFVFHKKGIIVSTSRKLFYLEDEDGDSKADIKKEVLRGFDNTDTHHSGYLQRSPHGGIILSEALFHRGQFETLTGVLRTKDTVIMSLDMDTRKLIVERQTEAPNPWKVSYNQWGESIQFYGGGQIIDAETHNVVTPMGSSALTDLGMPFRYDKGCSATFSNSPHFPTDWQGGFITSHLLSTNEINYTPMKLVDGAYRSAGKKTTILKSSNKVFRPTDLLFGHDGALYISDFYYPIIGHAQHSLRHKDRDYANGRVWRVTRTDSPTLEVENLETKTTTELIDKLRDPFLSIRQAARNELYKKPKAEVNTALAKAASAHQSDDIFALEILWLMERQKNFSNTSLIKKLVVSSDIKIKRSAVRSLRWWADALGSDLEPILDELATDSDERVKMGVITVLSHLQIKDSKWSNIGDKITTKPATPLAHMKTMLSWIDRPGLAPEFPILSVDPTAYLADSIWEKTDKGMKGSLFFNSSEAGILNLGHEMNPFLNLTVNDTPLLIASGGPHSKESQNSFTVKKGINKVEFVISNSKAYKRLVNTNFKSYITDNKGQKPKAITLTSNKEEAEKWEKQYSDSQLNNWQEFALKTFAKNCSNCHNVDIDTAIAPALKGLIGKQQTVISKDGTKREVTIDEAYIRKAIIDPMAEYREGLAPAMVLKDPLSEKEVDVLVKWLKQLK